MMTSEKNNNIQSVKTSDLIVRHSLIIIILFFVALGSGFKYINDAWQFHKNDATYYISIETRLIELKVQMLKLSQTTSKNEFVADALEIRSNLEGIKLSLDEEGIDTKRIDSIDRFEADDFSNLEARQIKTTSNLAYLEDQRFIVDSARLASELAWWKYGEQIWLIIFSAVILFSLTYFILFVRKINLRVSRGIGYLHTIVDKLHNPNTHSLVPFERKDEFSELARYIESTITNIRYDLNDASRAANNFEEAFQRSSSPMLIVSLSDSIVQQANDAFHHIWSQSSEALSEQLRIDWSLDTSENGHFEDLSGLIEQGTVQLKVGTSTYRVRFVESLNESNEEVIYVVFEKLDPVSEITILNASVLLMAHGNWGLPIRIMDKNSPFYEVSSNLETIRVQVQALFSDLEYLQEDNLPAVTKLQQIPTLFHRKIDQNRSLVEAKDNEVETLSRSLIDLSDSAHALESNFKAIFSNLNFERDDSSPVETFKDQLEDANRCVLDVKRALLPMLDGGFTDTVQRRRLVDLVHDIDLVIEQLSSPQYEVGGNQPQTDILKLVKHCSLDFENRLRAHSAYIENIKSVSLSAKQECKKTGGAHGSSKEDDSLGKRSDSWDDF